MRRHHAELANQKIQALTVQRGLEEKYQQIQRNQKARHPRSAVSSLVVANRQHNGSVNLVDGNCIRFERARLMNGVILIDKPAGWTSHDVVNRMRRILGQRSVGHLGTLDPLATGVLPLVVGNLTRLAQFYTTSEKSYGGVTRFGSATDTYAAAGDPLANPVNDNPINPPRPATLS